jgi:hypothetical protein
MEATNFWSLIHSRFGVTVTYNVIPQPTIASTTLETIFTNGIFTTSFLEIVGDNISTPACASETFHYWFVLRADSENLSLGPKIYNSRD